MMHLHVYIQAVRFLNKGKRLCPPPGCPRVVYELMIQCWYAPTIVVESQLIFCQVIKQSPRHHIYRNPASHDRPNFRTLLLRLIDTEELVLSIPQEDLDTHPQAGLLGSALTAGERMFNDLQNRYTEMPYFEVI